MAQTLLERARALDVRIRGVVDVPRERYFPQRLAMVVVTVLPLLGLVGAIVLLWGRGITGIDLALMLVFYGFTGLGITVGYHRLFTHKSFEAARPVRWLLAVGGSMAVQGGILDWVATHRRHHAYSDDMGDPHSPYVGPDGEEVGILKGLFHSHWGWMWRPDGTVHEEWAPDLLADESIMRHQRRFPLYIALTFIVPAVLGGLLSWSLVGAVSGLVWGGLVRLFLLHHATWAINSICHVFGSKPWKSRDEARNNVFMALLAFGEGWHNAHHAFPASARHGLRWWEFDISWIVIRVLAAVRLVKNIKLPSPAQLQRKAARAAV